MFNIYWSDSASKFKINIISYAIIFCKNYFSVFKNTKCMKIKVNL